MIDGTYVLEGFFPISIQLTDIEKHTGAIYLMAMNAYLVAHNIEKKRNDAHRQKKNIQEFLYRFVCLGRRDHKITPGEISIVTIDRTDKHNIIKTLLMYSPV